MQPDDLTLTLALRSADAAVALRRLALADLMADVREKKRELADAEQLREDAVRAILGQTPPRLFSEPECEQPPRAAKDEGMHDGWRDCPVADMELSDRFAQAVRKGHCRTIGTLADALRAGATFGLTPGEVDALRIDVNTVAGDDPAFEPLEPPAARKTCKVCGDGYCSAGCLKDLEATGGVQTVPAAEPMVCAPGKLLLTAVEGFPAEVARKLAKAGVKTLADLEPHYNAARDRLGKDCPFGNVVIAAFHGAYLPGPADLGHAVEVEAADALADHLHACGFTRPLPPNEVPISKRTVPVDDLIEERVAEREASAPDRLVGLPGFPVHLADLAAAAGLATVDLLTEAAREKYRGLPAKIAKRAGLLGCAVQVLADLVTAHEPAVGATHPYPEPGDEEGDLAAAEELLRPVLGPGTGRVQPPPAPARPTGEPITDLGVTADDLDAAVCCGTAWGKGNKPSPVKTVPLNGQPHAVLSSAGTGANGTESWEVRPLWTAAVFAQRHPGFPTRLKPSGIPEHHYTGVRVRVGKAEYLIGSRDEQRRLIAAPPTKSKKKAGAK